MLPVLPASPVCTPGVVLPVWVSDATPASPVGVALSPSPRTTVTAVMVDLLPSGKVVVCTYTLDLDAGLLVTEPSDETVTPESEAVTDGDELAGPIVDASPPTVVTMIMPAESVKVNTEPAGRDRDSIDEFGGGASELASGADSVLVDVTVTGGVVESAMGVDSVLGVKTAPSLVRSFGIDSVVTVAALFASSALEAAADGVADSMIGVGEFVGVTGLMTVPFTLS